MIPSISSPLINVIGLALCFSDPSKSTIRASIRVQGLNLSGVPPLESVVMMSDVPVLLDDGFVDGGDNGLDQDGLGNLDDLCLGGMDIDVLVVLVERVDLDMLVVVGDGGHMNMLVVMVEMLVFGDMDGDGDLEGDMDDGRLDVVVLDMATAVASSSAASAADHMTTAPIPSTVSTSVAPTMSATAAVSSAIAPTGAGLVKELPAESFSLGSLESLEPRGICTRSTSRQSLGLTLKCLLLLLLLSMGHDHEGQNAHHPKLHS